MAVLPGNDTLGNGEDTRTMGHEVQARERGMQWTGLEKIGPDGGEGFWRRRADSNRRIEVLQTSALTTWLRRLACLRAAALREGSLPDL